ncbi:MAG TPA: hypothetical protein VIM41_13930 [Gammaproteobacteria bacterium]
MEINFSTNSWLLGTLLIMAITTIPVKIGAGLFGALNKELKHCALAVVLGTISAILIVKFIGGFLALVLTFVAISLIYWQVLQISFAWSFIFTIVVILIQFAVIQGLGKFGELVAS